MDINNMISAFAEKTGCDIQHKGSPCNTCFHSIEDVDFKHLAWLLLLALRGDYNDYPIEDSIRSELGLNGE